MFDGDEVLARALLDTNAPVGGVDTTTAAAAGVCCASAASLAVFCYLATFTGVAAHRYVLLHAQCECCETPA